MRSVRGPRRPCKHPRWWAYSPGSRTVDGEDLLQGRLAVTQRADVVVVGGGHNGLVAAAYLARAGLTTVVCERRNVVGGAAVSEHPFGPDYTVTSLSYVVSLMPPDLVRDLRLDQQGYHVYPQGPYFAPRADGRYLRLPDDPSAAARRDRQVLCARRRRVPPLRPAPGRTRRGARAAPAPDPAAPRVTPAAGTGAAGAATAPAAGRPRAQRGQRGPAAHRQHRRPARRVLRERRAAGSAVRVRGDRHLGRARGRRAPRT